ncbi:MAG: glyoxylate/hydroxypyruvate reductase A [Balneolaceae bacterium]|nr:MAG: glyoxylate/hydroxypyruvate reductase A [Balneolaceae bacterium]
MSLLLISQNRDMAPFRDAIRRADADIDTEIWPDVQFPERVLFAVAWNHPKQVLHQYKNLKAVSSLGAGVDHLVSDTTLPPEIPLTRVVTASLADQMADFVLMSVLNLVRRSHDYFLQQKRVNWTVQPAYKKSDMTTGILGLGELGSSSAKKLARAGFHVTGWSRTKKELSGVETYSESELDLFLSGTNILVNLLPLTNDTEGILGLNLFKKLKQPAFLLNAARGEHLTEEDLIYALDSHILQHAVLDVFQTEPLPDSHPFWNRESVTITPHIASVTDPDETALLLIDNYKRVLSGQSLRFTVDKMKGY